MIADHLHDHADHVSIRQQSQQLAGEATMPYSVVGCCEIDEHSSGLSRKAILDVPWLQGDLVCRRSLVSKARLYPGRRENYVPYWDKECETLYCSFIRAHCGPTLIVPLRPFSAISKETRAMRGSCKYYRLLAL